MKYDLATKLLKKSKGRHDDLIKAFAAKDLHQPGLMQAVAASIGDGDTNLAHYVTETVLPAYGQAVVPVLVSAFDPNGKLVDARRLAAIRRIDPSTALQLARTALSASHESLVTEVIRSLQGSGIDSMSIFNLSQRRNERIQQEAFRALSGVNEQAVVDAVADSFKRGTPWVSHAIQFTPHPTYTALCVSALQTLGEAADAAGFLTEKQAKWLSRVLQACHGHGGNELDAALYRWVNRASKGFFTEELRYHWNKGDLARAAAMSSTPMAQRMLVASRDCFELLHMPPIMAAAAWHADLDLVELFSPYLAPSNKPGRCRGWFCGCSGDWPCSLYSAVEFALDVDFASVDYRGRKPHPLQLPVIQRIRDDPRWKTARLV
ncbi:MAG: hypothetical protein JNG86_17680 [Verrucomicrobiaceae bacterium]|nr:hypothetical protein [Verrucomicrobiaceae bacterium]